MKRTLLTFACSLILAVAVGSAQADEPAWGGYCPAKDKETCKKSYGTWNEWNKTCKIEHKPDWKRCNANFKALVKEIYVFKKDRHGKCQKEEKKRIIACKNKKGEWVDEKKCKKCL
jgi:hypothetical protein